MDTINSKALHQANGIPAICSMVPGPGWSQRPPACVLPRPWASGSFPAPGPPGRHPQDCHAGRASARRLRMDFHETLVKTISPLVSSAARAGPTGPSSPGFGQAGW